MSTVRAIAYRSTYDGGKQVATDRKQLGISVTNGNYGGGTYIWACVNKDGGWRITVEVNGHKVIDQSDLTPKEEGTQ